MKTPADSINIINEYIKQINYDLIKVKSNAEKKINDTENKTELMKVMIKTDKIIKIMGNMGIVVSKLKSGD